MYSRNEQFAHFVPENSALCSVKIQCHFGQAVVNVKQQKNLTSNKEKLLENSIQVRDAEWGGGGGGRHSHI